MLWIVQDDLYAKNQHYDLFDALTRLDIPFVRVSVAQNLITPDVPEDNTLPIITNGSIMLSNIGKARGWVPGSLFNDNFSYDIWSQHYQDLLLNKNAVISTLKNANVENFISEQIFARPILDNKTFNGKVFTKAEFLQFELPRHE